jgi:MFS-type transporter involved in bile tolerance (Atg22 family)
MPLYIIRNGLSDLFIGYFLFAVAVPTILFTYYFSNLAGKVGFKKIFRIGFMIPAALAFVAFFTSNVYVVLVLMALGSMGMAMLEATSEAYFFDVIRKKDESRFYGPYNTTIDVNHFISRVITSVILIFLPFEFIFLFFGASMAFFSVFSGKIHNVIEKNHHKRM